MNTSSLIHKNVSSCVFRTEAPDSKRIILVPLVLVTEKLRTQLGVILGGDLALFNSIRELLVERCSLSVETVVLVGGLGHANNVGESSNGFLVGDDGV